MAIICEKCGKTFSDKRYLRIHLNKKIPCDQKLACSKCGKEFKSVSNYNKHLKRKTPCAPEEVPVIPEDNPDNRCKFCNRTYATRSNLTRHQKTCDRERNMEAMVRLLIEQNQEMKVQMDTLTKQVALPNQTIINNIDNRQVNQLNINLVNFPIEDLSSLDMQEILQIVNQQPTNQIIPSIIEHIHGNPKYPEKQNIFMAKTTSEVTIVYGGDKEKTWHPVPKKQAMDHLKGEAMGVLTHNNKPLVNFKLIEAAHDISQRNTDYQIKIADLVESDLTEDDAIVKKLVQFGETFHKDKKESLVLKN